MGFRLPNWILRWYSAVHMRVQSWCSWGPSFMLPSYSWGKMYSLLMNWISSRSPISSVLTYNYIAHIFFIFPYISFRKKRWINWLNPSFKGRKYHRFEKKKGDCLFVSSISTFWSMQWWPIQAFFLLFLIFILYWCTMLHCKPTYFRCKATWINYNIYIHTPNRPKRSRRY